jgi:hypothetical protein
MGYRGPESSLSFYVDPDAPPITYGSGGPEDGATITTDQATFAFTASAATFKCALDDAEFSPCTSPKTVQNLDEGSHIFAVHAIDAQGRVGNAALRAFVVDAVPEPKCIEGAAAPFTDVPTGHPFCAEIRWMTDEGISSGFGDGTYRPSSPVTRQAMSAFLARLAGASLTACTSAPFIDVPVNHPFCREIKWMREQSISTGFDGGTTYRPGDLVTRQAMAAFLARVVAQELAPCSTAPFVDVPTDHPFCPHITWLSTHGIATGFGDHTYRPSSPVTRQAMAAFLYRLSAFL